MAHNKRWHRGFQAGYLQAQEEGIKLFAAIREKESEARAVEALQKATSVPSSVPTSETPAQKPSVSPGARVVAEGTQYRLTVQTGDSSKSMWFTGEEWAAIKQIFFPPKQISESQETSTESKAGGPGPVEPSDRCEWCFGRRDSHREGEWELHRLHRQKTAPSLSKESGERL